MLLSIRFNFCAKTRKDRLYIKARIKVIKCAIECCYHYNLSIAQELSLDYIKQEVKDFKVGVDGRALRRVSYMVEKLKETAYGKDS